MSFWTVSVGFLSSKPSVKIKGDVVYARTGFLSQLFSLFSYCKTVKIDKRIQKIEITKRIFWIFTTPKELHFDDVSYLDVEYRNYPTGWGFTDEGFGRTDEIEKLTVWLIPRDGKGIKLFSFWGEGAVETGMIGVLFGGDSVVDFRGNQFESAHSFAQMLAQFIRVPVRHPKQRLSAKGPAETAIKYICSKCGRVMNPVKPCIYCGSREWKIEK